MARKKKRTKGKRQQPLRNQLRRSDDPEALILDQLRQGKGRRALDLIRQARKSGLEQLSPALEFCALTARARELRRSGNPSAAEEMEQRAALLRNTIALADIPPRHVTEFIRHVNPESAVEIYLDLVSGPGTNPDAERALAYHVVCERKWASLDGLDSGHVLRSDLPTVREAVEAMDIGEWNAASRSLSRVGAHSPYAPWRMFCIAIQQLEKNDKISLARTLSHFPADFPLVETIKALKAYAGNTVHGTDPEVFSQLGLHRQGNKVLRRSDRLAWFRAAIEDGFKTKAFRQLAPVRIRQLAESLVPGNAAWAEKFIYDIFVMALQSQADDPDNLMHRLMNERTPSPSLALAMDRMLVRHQSKSHRAWSPDHVAFYLKVYKADFSDKNDQRLARSILLAELARVGSKTYYFCEEFAEEIDFLAALIGRDLSHHNLYVDLLEASIDEDPDYKPGYEALVDQLRKQYRTTAQEIEDVYLRMAERFPNDVEPLISVAQSLQRRKAHRRAETMVAHALEVSPDNPRLLNLKAVGHLISSDQGRKRGRVEVALRDYKAAEALNCDVDRCVMAQKRFFIDLVTSPAQSGTALQRTLEGRTEADQLRILALQLKDLEENRKIKTYNAEQHKLVQLAFDRKIAEIEGLESRDVLSLMSRVTENVEVLYQNAKVANHIRSHWLTLLKLLVSDRVVYAYDILLDCKGEQEIFSDIRERIYSDDVPAGTRTVLEFYRNVLLLSSTGRTNLPDRSYSTIFKRFVNEPDPSLRARLAATSKRLSRYFTRAFGRWLERFDQT